MENLDLAYLNDLVIKAQQGSSNAFAELYAATHQSQYAYAYRCLKDGDLALDALQETFVRALKNLRQLQSPELFIAWLSQISFHVCRDMKKDQTHAGLRMQAEEVLGTKAGPDAPEEEETVRIGGRSYPLQQIESLPLTESQVMLMRYYQDMKPGEVADMLNISRSMVRRYLKSAEKHLGKVDF